MMVKQYALHCYPVDDNDISISMLWDKDLRLYPHFYKPCNNQTY